MPIASFRLEILRTLRNTRFFILWHVFSLVLFLLVAGPNRNAQLGGIAMEAGVLGFIVKDAPAEQLADAIRRVALGERVVDPALAAATLPGGVSPLTSRERDELVLSRSGASVADIATKLFLSEGTIRNYLSSAMSKAGARNRIEAVHLADDRCWL